MRHVFFLATGALLAVCVMGCKQESSDADLPKADEVIARNQQPSQQPQGEVFQGKVLETMDAATYTYALLDTGDEKLWAAAPKCKIAVGDRVGITKNMPMSNFPSPTLNRTFELIYFLSYFVDANGKPIPSASGAGPMAPATGGTMGGAMSTAGHAAAPKGVTVDPIAKPEGGLSVAEIYAQKDLLAGKEVLLRGKVVKYNSQILGTNWMHVQDGSGDPDKGTHDITVNSDSSAQVGDVVLVKGVLKLDVDLQFGYAYDALIEKAEVKVE